MSNELTCDQAMALALRPLKTKSEQTAKIAELLGPTRKVRCFRDPSSAAKHPRLTGAEFLNLTVVGDIEFNSGAIVKLGSMTSTNTNNIVDMTTGSAVLVMEGNGHFVQGSLSIDGDTAFKLSANMFATSGAGFSPLATVQAYTYLASGVGPAAPEKTRAMAHAIKYYDWSDPLSPTLTWTNYFSKRVDNFSYQDVEMALENGDSAVWQTPTDSKVGAHLFGATLMLSDPQVTKAGVKVQQQVLIAMAHDNSWTNFPESNSYSRTAHVMALKPFKIVIEDMDGNVLYTFEMHDKEAINAPWLHSGDIGIGGRDAQNPLQPKLNILQQLIWFSEAPRASDFGPKLHAGMRNHRESMCKTQSSLISVEPLITGGYGGNSANGLGHFYYARKWPEKYTALTINDPFLDGHANASGSSAMYNGWIEGWGYEPGAYGCHNWYTSPGGPRNDRCPMASMLVRFLHDPDGVRVQENASNYDMAIAWTMNYFNHSCHYTPSPSTLQHIGTNAEMLNDEWAFIDTYYGQYTRDKQITLNASQRDGSYWGNYDNEGNMAMNGYGDDPLHDYGTRGVSSMVFRLPIVGLCNKFDFFKSMMLHQHPFGDISGPFMVRNMAWQWLHIVTMWKNASAHPLSITKKEIEDFFAKKLEALYSSVLKKAYVDNAMDARSIGIRNLGRNIESNGSSFADGGGRLGLYIGQVLMMMRQTGLWSAMRKYGGNCEAALLLTVKTADTFVFGNLVDAKGQGGVYFSFGDGQNVSTIPESWAAWYALRQQPAVTADKVDSSDFLSGGVNPDVSWNGFLSYIWMRRDYFPEITHPKLAAAVSEADRYEGIVTARVNSYAVTDYTSRRNADYGYRYPGVAPYNPPRGGVLGPY